MSRLRLPNGDDHPDAAGKHFDDATVLLPAGRSDGAAYLSGYVVECALKSLIVVGAGTPWGHDLNALGQEALRLAALPGARSAKYIPRMNPTHSLYDAASGWRETLRYREPGAVAAADAAAWLAEAQAVYESTIVPMRLDGVA
jgi:HEPN domain-containing protein